MRREGRASAVAPAAALLLAACGGGEDPRKEVPSDVVVCRENMRAIYAGLREYATRHGHAPEGSGARFLAALIAEGVWEDTPESRARLTCPGAGAQPVPPGTDWSAPATLDEASTAYAARDVAAHPFETFPAGGRVVVLACDDAAGMNHAGVLNVLYADGAVRTFELADLIAAGRVPADATGIVVGPRSPLEELRVLVEPRP